MSSCGSKCGCGSSCSCGSNCSCSKYSFDMSYAEKTSTETLVLGVGPVKPQLEGAEVAAEDNGCKCGSNCTCDPCNCK
ncbi:Metallothionein [Vigna unguiculata]|uniref:Metallothionein-like protein n=1 Tax=Vigna unguiculata TaxID=3917 RepID=A0A4D6MU88_VIGUN|nr:Metallothionein [Vigna unguiculata]